MATQFKPDIWACKVQTGGIVAAGIATLLTTVTVLLRDILGVAMSSITVRECYSLRSLLREESMTCSCCTSVLSGEFLGTDMGHIFICRCGRVLE